MFDTDMKKHKISTSSPKIGTKTHKFGIIQIRNKTAKLPPICSKQKPKISCVAKAKFVKLC